MRWSSRICVFLTVFLAHPLLRVNRSRPDVTIVRARPFMFSRIFFGFFFYSSDSKRSPAIINSIRNPPNETIFFFTVV